MFKISLYLLVFYLFCLILKIGFNFTFSLYFFINPIFNLLFLIIILIKLIILLIKKEQVKNQILTAVILVIPLIGLFFQDKIASTENIKLSAYSEGVINGADIHFYEKGNMEYCSLSLLGEQCYLGKYKMNGDTFKVEYLNKEPLLKAKKMIKRGKKFLFLNQKNEIEYEFYLSSN